MELSRKNPKVKHRQTEWHKKGSHTKGENRLKEKPKSNIHVERLKTGLGMVFNRKNFEAFGEFARNAGQAAREMDREYSSSPRKKSKKSKKKKR